MEADNAAALGEILGQQFVDMQKQEEATRAELRTGQDQAAALRSQVLQSITAKLSKGNTPALPKEVQEIAAALCQQPRLIAPVGAYLRSLVAAINAAVDQAISNSTPPSSSTPPAAKSSSSPAA